jgi:hypothetical protein
VDHFGGLDEAPPNTAHMNSKSDQSVFNGTADRDKVHSVRYQSGFHRIRANATDNHLTVSVRLLVLPARP